MKKKIIPVLMLSVLAQFAHAEYLSTARKSSTLVTVNFKGTSISYDLMKNQAAMQKLEQLTQAKNELANGLNAKLAELANQQGAGFSYGRIEGDPNITITPNPAGYLLMGLSGVSYAAGARYSKSKWGVLKADCDINIRLDNISAVAQYGSSNGQPSGDASFSATPSSSTSCDASLLGVPLNWVPFLGQWIDNKANSIVLNGVRNGLSKVKDGLYFDAGQNWQTGIAQIIPRDKVIKLPDGSTFPIGAYIQDNLSYIISNSNVSMKIGQLFKNTSYFYSKDQTGLELVFRVVEFKLNSPALSFDVGVFDHAQVTGCYVPKGAKQCIPE
ncbi:hypothetical protein [Chromobacterium vaccinii]|uniref:hypothetical protein n=1 Tax=Chromobacterium vaccinii TaxID=1108595 RepID=UPI0011AB543A|nr:hypothetical protein [Chromobacterium vaccinii]